MSKAENGKKVAIVLGGTKPHVNLIENLKCRNYYTILIDYLKNSPGIDAADEFICESTLDVDKVLEIATEKKASLVISTCIDQANSTCCYVAEQLGLPKPYDYQTSLNVTNKALMKKIMVDNGIPTSAFEVVSSLNEIDLNHIVYPAVVKPVDCNSSKGVHRVDTKEETEKYLQEALQLSRSGEAIIEGYNEGDEIQVDCFATNGKAEVIMSRQKKKIKGENGMVLQSTGSVIPAPLSEELKNLTKEIADKIAVAFGLENTPFFYQAIVKDNKINVLEFAPRIGGGLSYYLIKTITGFDVLNAAIDSFLGQVVFPEIIENRMCYSTNLLYMEPGVFKSIEGLDKLKEQSIIKDFFVMKKPGTIIDNNMSSGNRVGAFVVEAVDYDSLLKKEQDVLSQIEIYNEAGKPGLNRKVY